MKKVQISDPPINLLEFIHRFNLENDCHITISASCSTQFELHNSDESLLDRFVNKYQDKNGDFKEIYFEDENQPFKCHCEKSPLQIITFDEHNKHKNEIVFLLCTKNHKLAIFCPRCIQKAEEYLEDYTYYSDLKSLTIEGATDFINLEKHCPIGNIMKEIIEKWKVGQPVSKPEEDPNTISRFKKFMDAPEDSISEYEPFFC